MNVLSMVKSDAFAATPMTTLPTTAPNAAQPVEALITAHNAQWILGDFRAQPAMANTIPLSAHIISWVFPTLSKNASFKHKEMAVMTIRNNSP
jgi:hypothetical protein